MTGFDRIHICHVGVKSDLSDDLDHDNHVLKVLHETVHPHSETPAIQLKSEQKLFVSAILGCSMMSSHVTSEKE